MLTKFILSNIAARTSGLKITPYWLFSQTAVTGADSKQYAEFERMSEEDLTEYIKSNAIGVPMQTPLELRVPGEDWWLLPYEPLVTLKAENIIVKRNVSKGNFRGSIKERWTQSDWSITINGILINEKSAKSPEKYISKLLEMCKAGEIEVRSSLFEIFSINRICIESYSFPHTVGPQNQAYTISAVSDDVYKLLLKNGGLE